MPIMRKTGFGGLGGFEVAAGVVDGAGCVVVDGVVDTTVVVDIVGAIDSGTGTAGALAPS